MMDEGNLLFILNYFVCMMNLIFATLDWEILDDEKYYHQKFTEAYIICRIGVMLVSVANFFIFFSGLQRFHLVLNPYCVDAVEVLSAM